MRPSHRRRAWGPPAADWILGLLLSSCSFVVNASLLSYIHVLGSCGYTYRNQYNIGIQRVSAFLFIIIHYSPFAKIHFFFNLTKFFFDFFIISRKM